MICHFSHASTKVNSWQTSKRTRSCRSWLSPFSALEISTWFLKHGGLSMRGVRRHHKRAPFGWFGGKWFLVRDYAVMDSPQAMTSFAAGGIAGMLSKIGVAPVERVKLLTQIEGLRASRRSIIRIAYDVWHLEGFQAFWKGNGPTVLRVIPNKGILFLCNDYYLSLMTFDSDISLWGRFFAGSLSGATSVTFTYPLEVLQSRMASGSRKYVGIVDCFLQTWRVDGMRAFYKGYSASLFGIIPYTGSQFFLYEGGKNWIRSFRSQRELSIWEKFMIGAISGKCAQAFSYPMDTIRKRLQVGSLHAESEVSASPRECCRNIFKNEGVSGFYRGMSLNAFRAMPSQGIQFAAYEVLKDLFGIKIL